MHTTAAEWHAAQLDDAIEALNHLKVQRAGFHRFEADYVEDLDADLLVIDILEGVDHEGLKVWSPRYRSTDYALATSYVALYHAGRMARITRIKRFYRGGYSGTILKTHEQIVPDGFEGVMQRYDYRI